MEVVLIGAMVAVVAGLGAALLLRRGVRWRLLALYPAAVVSMGLLAGSVWREGEISGGWVVFALGAGLVMYSLWLLSWPLLRPVFERFSQTRW